VIRPFIVVVIALAVTVPAAALAQGDALRSVIGSCTGCRLPHDLRGRDLHGLRFVGADLRDVDLSRANLRDSEFTGADLDGTRFDDADLRDARFVGVRLHGTSFARANTTGVTFVGASVGQAEVDGPAGRLILHDCTGCSLRGLDLHGADLRGSRIIGASLGGANLSRAKLSGAQLIGISARDADLSGSDLSGANLIGANLTGARLRGATIGDAIVCSPAHEQRDSPVTVTACANLRGVDLHGLDLRNARWCDVGAGERETRTCRTVTRRELIDDAHADLTGAQAPA